MMKTALMTVALVFAMAPVALACGDHENMTTEQKVEMHQKMAQTHASVAECLKAGKPEAECHQLMADAMPKSCAQASESGKSCPHMMGHGKHGKMHKK